MSVPGLTLARTRNRRLAEHIMGVNLNPYLHFDGEAADALAFYADVLGGSPSSMTYGEMGMEGDAAKRIMHGQIETAAGITLMVSDLPPGSARSHGNDVTISLSGDDDETLRRHWARLSDGGQVETELEKQMWGDVYGACTDRFGVGWMVNIAGEH
jgi:PhnB protein